MILAGFAEFVNANMFQGRNVVHKDIISPLDISMICEIKDAKKSFKYISRERDVFKSIRWSHGNSTMVICIGVEGQNAIDYTMIFREMLYTSIAYLQMAENQKKADKTAKKVEKVLKTGAEYMCGLGKEQKLPPIITLIFYTGSQPWHAGTSLYEIVDIPECFRPFVSDYHINLVWGMDESKLENYIGEMYNVIRLLILSQKGNIDEIGKIRMDAKVAHAAAILGNNPKWAKRLEAEEGEIDVLSKLEMELDKRDEIKAIEMTKQTAFRLLKKNVLHTAEEVAEDFDVSIETAKEWYMEYIQS